MTRTSLAAIAAVLAFATPSVARSAPPADDARARAAESFREAQAAFARRDFAAAAAAFEAAADFAPHPAALLSASEAWERAGEPARAADDCDRARSLPVAAEASAADHVDYARDARQCIERLRPRVALIDVVGAAAAVARVDDGPQSVLPLRAWVRPGHHVVVTTDLATSRARRDEVDVAAGEEGRIDVLAPPRARGPAAASAPSPSSALAPAPSSVPAPASASAPALDRTAASPRTFPSASWVSFGVAVPSAIAYGVFAALTVSAKSAYDAGPSEDTKNTFYRDRAIADVTFGVALAAAATGVVLWLASGPASPSTTARGPLASPGVLRF